MTNHLKNSSSNNTSGGTITVGTSATVTTMNGLITSGTNIYYVDTSTVVNAIEYLQGGASVITHDEIGDFNLSSLRLNKILFIACVGSQVQTITLPTTPRIGQMLFIRCGKGGGSIILQTSGSRYIFTTTTSLLGTGTQSLTLSNLGTTQWCYYDSNRWAQMA